MAFKDSNPSTPDPSTEGDPAILRNLPVDTKGSVAELRDTFTLTPAVDVLKLFLPHNAQPIVSIFNGMESLDDFNR